MYACLDLGATNIRGTWIDASGEHGNLVYLTRPNTLKGTKEILISIVRQIEQDSPQRIRGIGLASAAPLDRKEKKYLQTSNTPELDYFRVGDFLQENLRLPVLMENDAQAAAWGEVWKGSLAGSSDAVVLTLGSGVGSGVILDSGIWRAGHVTVPELEHIYMGESYRVCGCGQNGCAEVWLNKEALLEIFLEQGCVFHEMREMADLLANGDNAAQGAMKVYGRRLGLFIGILQVIFGFDNIGISGGLSSFVPYCEQSIWQELQKRLEKRHRWLPKRIVSSREPEMSAL